MHCKAQPQGTATRDPVSILAGIEARVRGQITEQHELELGIDHAPPKLRRYGYRDAHTRPLVSANRGKVSHSFRVAAADAWKFPRIQLQPANAFAVLTLDCDGRDSVQSLSSAIATAALPQPNVIVARRASGNVHADWFLADPVHVAPGSRMKPQRKISRVSEFYREAVGADAGFTETLTHNPMSRAQRGAFRTIWGRKEPYSLDELAEVIPFGWRCPTLSNSRIGRNCTLFDSLMRESGKPSNWGKDVEPLAIALNERFRAQGLEPLGHIEVREIARSVNRIQARNLASGQTQRQFSCIQAARGRKGGKASGEVRRRGSLTESAPWEAEGIHRATWYRRKARRGVRHEAKAVSTPGECDLTKAVSTPGECDLNQSS